MHYYASIAHVPSATHSALKDTEQLQHKDCFTVGTKEHLELDQK